MSASPVTRQRVRATSSKERLFEAAMKLLATRSPEAVSVDEIASAAGVSKGTVYYNYGSKDELVSQILDFGAQKLLRELTKVATGPAPYLVLKSMLEFAMDFVASYPAFVQLWMQEQLGADTSSVFTTMPLHSQVTNLIIDVLDRLVEIPESEKLPVATTIFGAALFNARMSSAREDGLERDQMVRAVMLIVDGLLATRPAATN
ncbi:TetR/AcrR family transcriptional regulator [Glutamicibacter sp. JC586]|uniref:TetR/AcrR family transcriptional regulator n=1 Tax=Glutamicibacter sp. JC586 TaxID=2590552 RepID=UPI00135CDF6F|nr:TetR/AcrR family transcriptional regulator [Glutamicibacter sp. JC586]